MHVTSPSPARSSVAPLLVALGVVAVAAPGCGSGHVEPIDAPCSTTYVERLTQSSVERIDILLAIDNSRSMADKQEILARAVPDLVEALVNPPCIDAETGEMSAPAPGPLERCPEGLERRFDPILDVHVGIISSSLGGHGADVCAASDPDTRSNDDHGRLLARSSADQDNDLAPSTYQGKRFLAWDPAQQLAGDPYEPDPGDGEADLEADSAADLNTTALIPVLAEMVRGVGQSGCGYEAQLESWYRFLVDPEPYETISVVNGQATPQGIDEALLQQRADFLRPDSLLTILLLSDENDCSLREGGQYYLAGQQNNADGSKYHLPRPRSECASNPNDPCCLSCSQDAGDCPEDPSCYVNNDPAQGVAPLSDMEDHFNLRCFEQKRRFGMDFLYPIGRYTDALTLPQIQNRKGEVVDNPLFVDLDPTDHITVTRDPGLVFLTGIVGVPWQDIARDPGDLTRGFKNPDELWQPINDWGKNTWDVILGDPENYVYPFDPFMIEAPDPRSGQNPITGDAIQPPGSATENAINGTEWEIPTRNDLQYACVFDLLPGSERDCSVPNTPACDCEAGTTNPLCAIDPATGERTALQVRAKAYPGLRQLALLRSLGSQGIVGSACPAQFEDEARFDFGYRPAIGTMLDRLTPAVSGQCLPRTLDVDEAGRVACAIVEARKAPGACDCDGWAGRRAVAPEHAAIVDSIEQDPLAGPSGWNCFCEIPQLAGEELAACQEDASEPVQTGGGEAVDGFCYVDQVIGLGNPEIVAGCPSTQKRTIRVVGRGKPASGATLFITCQASCQGS